MTKPNQNDHDEDAGKGAVERDGPGEETNVSTNGQLGHRNQDQLMDHVDFPNLNARLRQNTVQEKLSNLWLERLLAGSEFPHV